MDGIEPVPAPTRAMRPWLCAGISDWSRVTVSEPCTGRGTIPGGRRPGPDGWHRSLQVGQGEGRFAVAAIIGAEQREERGVLRDRQQLAVALGPAGGGEIAPEHADLGDEWGWTCAVLHYHGRRGGATALVLLRKYAEQRDDVADREGRLDIVVRLAAAGRREIEFALSGSWWAPPSNEIFMPACVPTAVARTVPAGGS